MDGGADIVVLSELLVSQLKWNAEKAGLGRIFTVFQSLPGFWF
jgi:hypothetical protein